MDAVATYQFQYIPVLREKRDRRCCLALEHTLQVFSQRKTGALDLGGGIVAAQLRPLHEFLRQCLHDPQHLGRCAQAHHLQGADRLMQLLARNAQLARIEIGKIGAARQFGITHKPAQRLGCAIEGFSQLVEHPREWSQVAGCQFAVSLRGNICLHLVVHSCQ